MIKAWWEQYIKYPDPAYERLIYAFKVLLAVVIAIFVIKLAALSQAMWIILTSIFISLLNRGVGFKFRLRNMLCAGLLSLVALTLGILTYHHWVLYSVCLLVVSFCSVQFIKYGLEVALVATVPLIFLIIVGAMPVDPAAVLLSYLSALYGIVIALFVSLCIFPYRLTRVLKSARNSLSYYYLQLYNAVFLSFLTGNYRLTAFDKLRDAIFTKLGEMNNMVYALKNHEEQAKGKLYFSIFAQGIFISRLFYEAQEPGRWLYLRNELESLRVLVLGLLNEWHHKKPLQHLDHLSAVLATMPEGVAEVSALKKAIAKLVHAVSELS